MRRFGTLWVLLALLPACAPRTLAPEARFLGGEIRGLELSPTPALLLGLRVAFQNPNPFPLPLSALGARLRVGEVVLPLDLSLPPGEREEVLLLRLTPKEALATAQALLSREGAEVALEGQTLGQPRTFFRTRLSLPLEPPMGWDEPLPRKPQPHSPAGRRPSCPPRPAAFRAGGPPSQRGGAAPGGGL